MHENKINENVYTNKVNENVDENAHKVNVNSPKGNVNSPKGIVNSPGCGVLLVVQSHRSPMPLSNFCAISPVPDAFAEFPQRPSTPSSLLRGLCWNHWFRPFCA